MTTSQSTKGAPSSTRQHQNTEWVLAEQVLKAPHHSQLTALADSVKMLSDWIVHQPCSEEAWNTRLPNEEARPAPPHSRGMARSLLGTLPTAAVVAAQVAAVHQAKHCSADTDDVGAAARLEPRTARHEELGARVEAQHRGKPADVRYCEVPPSRVRVTGDGPAGCRVCRALYPLASQLGARWWWQLGRVGQGMFAAGFAQAHSLIHGITQHDEIQQHGSGQHQ